MSRVSEYPAESSPTPAGFLFMAVLQPDLTYKTRKVAPSQIAGGTTATTDDTLVFDNFDGYTVGAISTLDDGYGWSNNGTVTNGTIVSRTSAGLTSNRLSLANGELIRKLPWAGNWQRMMIGFLFRINAVATFTNAGVLGLCSGQTNTVSSATTANFLGICGSGYAAGGTNDTVFTTGTRFSYFVTNPAIRYVTRRGNISTDQSSGASTSGGVFAGATEGCLGMMLLDVSRPVFATNATSVTYSFGRTQTTVTVAEYYAAKNALRDALTADPSGTIGGMGGWNVVTGSNNNTNSFSFDQSTGVFDTLNLQWPHTSQPLEIAALGVRKVF